MTDVRSGPEARVEQAAAAAPPARPSADELKRLRDAVVDAAAVSSGLWFSYLLVLFYLLVGVAGVTQRDLLLSDIVALPFLSGVQLPLRGFAALGPLIFVVTHAYVMLHLSMLASKVAAFDAGLARVESSATRSQLRGELPLNIFVQLFAGPDEVQRGPMAVLLGLAASISLVIGPIGLLVFFVLQFLPAHDEVVTWLQRLLVVADLVLLWLLGPPIVTRTRRGPRRRTAAAMAALVAMVLVSAMALQIVFAAATFRGERLNTVMAQVSWRGPGWGWQVLWSDHLVLDHANVSGDARAGPGSVAALQGHNLEGATLTNDIMQRFDLTNAKLRGAELSFTQLQGSHLDGAQLEGAKLTGAKLQGATLDHASLVGANLASAQLQGANLQNAHLEGANLDHAQLQGAILDGASLQGAILDGAQLQGASLKGTNLQGASLQKAFVWRADPATATMGQARIAALITDRRQFCDAAEGCPWPAPFDEMKALIARHVSDDDVDPIEKHLWAQFVPPDHDDRDAALERSWSTLQQASPGGGFERAQALAWTSVGCATTPAAPFVVTQMLQSLKARGAHDAVQRTDIGTQFLQPDCAGARGVSLDTRKDLLGP